MRNQPRPHPIIAVAGNPNAGKTTIFNALTGSRHKVANYPGVTVERKQAPLRLPSGVAIELIDLPGCYSLTARSPEEQIAHEALLGRIPDLAPPALVLCVLDASNLERNLYLATQFLDHQIPLVVVLNMMDIAREKGIHVDPQRLAEILGCPVVPTVGRRKQGIHDLVEVIENQIENGHPRIRATSDFIDRLPDQLEEPVSRLAEAFADTSEFRNQGVPSRSEALWVLLSNLDGDDPVRLPCWEIDLARKIRKDMNLSTGELRRVEAHARYDHIRNILERSKVAYEDRPHSLTERIDSVVLHPVAGPLLMAGVFAVVFQSIFAWATPGMDAIDALFAAVASGVNSLLPESLLKGLIIDGVISGVGNTLIFLPQILILFLFLGLLEDSGYLARAGFLLDRFMRVVGLDGKSFIPLLSSFACAVPGIMATRTIPTRKDRLVTILIAPLMTCSARLPVYVLIIATVFPAQKKVFGLFNLGGVVLLGLYVAGIIGAIAMAYLFKRTLLKSPKPPLLLELPTYKLPSLKSILILLKDRTFLFIRRAGTIILSMTIILWALLTFPRLATGPSSVNLGAAAVAMEEEDGMDHGHFIADNERSRAEASLKHSFAGRLGRLFEPIIEPLGFDWKIGIGLIASFAAREVFVGAMGVIYGISTESEVDSVSLRDALRSERRPETGLPLYTPLVGLSILAFYVFACQCMSTLAVARRETLSWRWPLFMFGYMTVLAWAASFIVYQGGLWMGFR